MHLDLLARIYPAARETAAEADKTGCMRTCLYNPEAQTVLAVVEQAEYILGYLADLPDSGLFDPATLRRAFGPYRSPAETRPVYFNIYGRSLKAMRMAREIGFRLDMHGLKLAYSGPPLPEPPNPNWETGGYQPGTAPQIAALLDRAYEPLVRQIGGEPGSCSRHIDRFEQELEALETKGGVYTFWNASGLAAVGLVRGSYLRDFAVDPTYQNLGLGSAALACIVNDRLGRGIQAFHLDVAVANTGAQRFYARHGFREIGCFADHTLVRDS